MPPDEPVFRGEAEAFAEDFKASTAFLTRLPADWLELMRFLSGYYQRPLGETLISS